MPAPQARRKDRGWQGVTRALPKGTGATTGTRQKGGSLGYNTLLGLETAPQVPEISDRREKIKDRTP